MIHQAERAIPCLGGIVLRRLTFFFSVCALSLCAPLRAATRGDVNGDGLSDGRDVSTMTGLLTGSLHDAATRGRADLNCDGLVDRTDAEILLRGLVDRFSPGENQPTGDLSGDGLRDGRDIEIFVAVMTGVDTNSAHVMAADIDRDGLVGPADVPLLVQLLTGSRPGTGTPQWTMGDVDRDRRRTGNDIHAFIKLLSGMDRSLERLAAADITRDGLVNVDDVPGLLDLILNQTGSMVGDWTPPLGVPMPEFGIRQTHYDFVDQSYDFGFGCEPYRDAGSGPYTHYVDNTHPEATDGDNPYGSPRRPRASIPYYLLPGSVVELHGGPYESYFEVRVQGTAQRPIYIRGADPQARVPFKTKLLVLSPSRYVILENLSVDRDYQSSGVNIEGVDHISIRNCEVTDVQGGILAYGGPNTSISHIVIYKNHIHDLGDLSVAEDIDDNGIQVGGGSSDVWVVDNVVHHTVGSGIVLNPGFEFGNEAIRRVYVGRNTVYQTRQSGCWTKQSSDAVFSQNTVYSIIGTSFAISTGLGFQYGPERTWFIFNHVYDCEYGIGSGSNNVPHPGLEQFFLGNVIHDIHHRSPDYNPNNRWSSSAMMLVGGFNRVIADNTIYNCDAGINGPGPGSYRMENNVIANIVEPGGNHVFIENTNNDIQWELRSCCLYDESLPVRVRERNQVYNLAQLAQELNKGQGCIDSPPGFINAAAADFHLSDQSSTIDVGIATAAYDRFEELYGISIKVDYDGVNRPQAAGFDMGAFERR